MRTSARTGAGLPELVEAVREMVAGPRQRVTVRLPTTDGRAIAFVEKHTEVLERRYDTQTVEMDVITGQLILTRLRDNFPSSQILQCA
jgi:50S ribosomal subunit-associated GTPase HflX